MDEKEEEDYEIQDATMLYIGHRQRIFRNFEYRSFAVIEGYIGVTEGSGGGGGYGVRAALGETFRGVTPK